jgi:tetratricopeptide (TPR) repeat protein
MLPPLWSWWSLGSTEGETSKARVEYEVAEEMYRQILKRFDGNHDARQPDILCGLRNLGAILTVYGKLEEAEKAFARVLAEIGGSSRPEDILGLSQTLNNLAMVKLWQNKVQGAEIDLRRALHCREENLAGSDERDPNMLYLYNNLVATLNDKHRVREKRDLLEQVIERYSYLSDFGCPDIVDVLGNLKNIQNL